MKAITITENDFNEAVFQSDVPVLIDFWSTTCVPCRSMSPIIDEIAECYSEEIRLIKVNVTECPNIAAQFNVSKLPTLSIVKDGIEVYRLTGAQSFESIKEALNDYLE